MIADHFQNIHSEYVLLFSPALLRYDWQIIIIYI